MLLDIFCRTIPLTLLSWDENLNILLGFNNLGEFKLWNTYFLNVITLLLH